MPTTGLQPLRRLEWIAQAVPLLFGAPEVDQARRFLDSDVRLLATGTADTTIEFLCHDRASAERQAHKLRIAVLDARQRAALAERLGPSAAEKAARFIALAVGA